MNFGNSIFSMVGCILAYLIFSNGRVALFWIFLTCDHSLHSVIRCAEGRHDTFVCRIVCSDARFWHFFLIGRETILIIRCILIGRHISTTFPVKVSPGQKERKMTEMERFSEENISAALAEAPYRFLVWLPETRAKRVLTAANLFARRCFGRSAYGFWEELKSTK